MEEKIKLVLTKAERTMIVAALMAYAEVDLAIRIAEIKPTDPAEDGPEVAILSALRGETHDA